MPSNWLVFDRIRALAKQNRVFSAERTYQDQTQLDKVTSSGEFFDFSQSAAILDQTNLQINRLERYKDYEQMAQTGEVSLALDLYADEASTIDSERKHTIIIRARNRRLKRELEDLFHNSIRWDNYCRPAIRYLCKYGDMPWEIVLNENRSAVSSLKFMNVYNFTRIETRYGDLVGFFYMDAMSPKPQFLHPWQVSHMRLTNFENLYHPYGLSILDGGRKAFKQLRLMEDSALIYRITRCSEKRKFTIPVGNIPPKEVPEYMLMIARNFKRARFYNPATGTFDERYSPLVQEDDFFLPRRGDGSGPDIDVLPGAENLDQIADIEYFKKKMIAPMKIPFARVGLGEGAGEASEKSLSQSHSEFAKAVQWIQREVATGLTKIAIVHLALRGYSVEDLKGFEIALTATSAMEELYRIETWQTRVAVMAELKDLGWFPKEWIVTHFTDLAPDEIEELKDMESEASGVGGGGGLDVPGGDGGTLDAPAEGEDPNDPNAAPPADPLAGAQPPAEDESQMITPEGYDVGAEKRLINEMLDEEKRGKTRAIVESWAKRLGRGPSEEVNFSSGFDAFIESRELDGLSYSQPSRTNDYGLYNPNSDAGLLVEWSVDPEMRNQAIKECYDILTEVDAIAESVEDEPGVITEADINAAASNSDHST